MSSLFNMKSFSGNYESVDMSTLVEDKSGDRSQMVYTTAMINAIKEDIQNGYLDVDWNPFYNRDVDLRASNISFQMSEVEKAEWVKCFNDPMYFIGNYCKFKVDEGYALVDLRDYQKEIIQTVVDERYD